MKRYRMVSLLVLGSVAIGAVFTQAQAAPASAEKPFQLEAFIGATFDDNIFRLANSAEGEALLGTRDLSDWYRFLGLGFDGLVARENQRFEFRGEVKRQVYEEFSDFDHTAGQFRAAWNWKVSAATRGDLGYRYRRELRSFANQDVPRPDIITENAFFAFAEHQFGQRWMVRFGGETADLQFSASPLLRKQRNSLEAEVQYAASQQSTFGLLTTFTRSAFDAGPALDFSGWSVGPSIRWQPRPKLTFTANVSNTHQALEQFRPDVEDFDGITGFVAADWQPNLGIRWRLRAYRDITDLGGEIALFTIRSGISLQPSWQITEKLASRAQLEIQSRDFIRSSLVGIDRKDDYSLAELWFDLTMARRWIVSLGLGAENRSSNVDARSFDDITVHATIRFNL